MTPDREDGAPWRNFYGRRKGKGLRPSQEMYLDEDLGALSPSVGIIGAEPYINGVAMLLGKVREAGVSNLRIHPGDARDLFDVR